MKIFDDGFIKYVSLFFALVALGIVTFLIANFWGNGNLLSSLFNSGASESEQIKIANELEEKYRNDIYGGSTPEETLRLFIDALKKGDTDLASKYFVIEKQDQMKEELRIAKEKGNLKLLLQDLQKEKIGKELFAGAYQYNTYDENDKQEFSFDLSLNQLSNRWKIESL